MSQLDTILNQIKVSPSTSREIIDATKINASSVTASIKKLKDQKKIKVTGRIKKQGFQARMIYSAI